MSIGPDSASSSSNQVLPGPAAAASSLPVPASQVSSTSTLPIQQQPSPASSKAEAENNHHASNKPSTDAVQHPLPPKSAVSLQAAAAANASLGNSTPSALISASATSEPSAIAIDGSAIATGSAIGIDGSKPPATCVITLAEDKAAPSQRNALRQPNATKPKQKRRSLQTGTKEERVYQPGPSTAGGTIGVSDPTGGGLLSAAGGGRKALPELVLPFQLPFTDILPPMPMLDNASVRSAMSMGASETSSPDSATDSDDYSVLSDESDNDGQAQESRRLARRRRRQPATIEESLVLLQSLRQSRLSHLSSLLTPFSQRVRSGMIYPNVLPLSLLHGLNPRDPHILIQLGRADIHVGPHVFVKTKFWEVRPDYDLPASTSINASVRVGSSSSFAMPHNFGNASTTPGPTSVNTSPAPLTPTPATSVPITTATTGSLQHGEPPVTCASSPRPASVNQPAANLPSVAMTTAPSLPAVPLPSAPVANSKVSVANKQSPAAAPGITASPLAALTPSPKSSLPTSSGASTASVSPATVRPHIPLPNSSGPINKPGAITVALPRPPMATPSLPRPPTISQTSNNTIASSSAISNITSQSASVGSKPASSSAPANPTGPSASSGGLESTAAAPSTAPAKSADAPRPLNPTQTQSRPTGPPPPPAIDAALVSRVNATAALNPELQELLHVAASGKASPNQLKALGVWIQAITVQLREDEARNISANAGASSSVTGTRPTESSATGGDGRKFKKYQHDDSVKVSKKQAKVKEREAKKQAKAEAKVKAAAEKQKSQKHHKQHNQCAQQHPSSSKLPHPPPGWPVDGPPKPPVIIVEFRENPSMRFILPLWKCLVERTEGAERPSLPKIRKERRGFFDSDSDDEETGRIEPELKLSFFAPSLGSDAADGSGLRELEEELKRKAAEEAKMNASRSPPAAAQSPTGSTADLATGSPQESSATLEETTANISIVPSKKGKGSRSQKVSKSNKAEVSGRGLSEELQNKKHEIYPLTWSIKGGVTESLWEAFGRVPGTMTCQPVKREPEIELEPDVAEFLVPEIRYHLLDLPMEEMKVQKETTETFIDLYSQTPDRHYIVPRIGPALLPQGLEDHLQDKYAVRPQAIQGRPVAKRKAGARDDDISFSYEGIGLTVIGPNGVKTEPGAVPPKPPKRKRHVATHNPDGSIKSCGACGKTKTPMWRRGPKGPSQLCNACGARWKAGRLVVPEVALPPIIESEQNAEEKTSKDEEEGSASVHGSNALVIPQSSVVDETSFTVIHGVGGPYTLTGDKENLDFASSHLGRGSTSPSPFIRSPVPEDEVMPASVDPSMLSTSMRVPPRR